MVSLDSAFSVEADLLYERSPDRRDERITAVNVLDEFLTNAGRLAKFIEPCKIKVNPKDSLEIASTVDKGELSVLQWNDIKQVHALAPSHPRYNNVVSIWSSRKIYLVHLKNIQAGTFAAYLNATQHPSLSLFDSQKETDVAMLEKCFDELERFTKMESSFIRKKLVELKKLDEEILQLTGKKTVKRWRRFLSRLCSCCFVGCAMPPLDECLQNRNSIIAAFQAKQQKTGDALQTVRHAYLIFTRVAPTLQRIGYCNSQVEFGRKLTEQFANVAFCAKTIATLRSAEPGGAEMLPKSQQFALIASVNAPPLTDVAIKTIETYLPECPELAADWSNFGRHWSLSIHEQEMDWSDWNMAHHQHLKELNRDVDMLRSSLRKSYQQLVERQMIAEVEQTKRLLQERLKEVEQQKQAIVNSASFDASNYNLVSLFGGGKNNQLPPARMAASIQRAFVAEVKKHSGRALLVTQPSNDDPTEGDEGAMKIYDKENLELLEELHSGRSYRVRNADGCVGCVPASAVVEMKL